MALLQKYSELTKAVFVQMEIDDAHVDFASTMQDIANHGADAGFHGFIYYHETCDYYDANQELIWEALCDDAEASFGSTPMQIIAGFTSYINSDMSLKNVLAWYALERAANEVTNA